ncbi:hypothetical protein COY17_03955 [Candidatus Saccharibacteria bacterium CG_4_10_14_0_2_um_filter_52_9]|nr:MAG: hypothetical protein COY17_03955 [Candidatus Saccharibacteria bacterium CG_4_10_14_0_2_um_filter_52_9]
MPKQKFSKTVLIRVRAFILVLAALGIAGGASIAHADQFDEQINALRVQNNDAQSLVNNLANQAGSYQGAINQLQAQISALQAALNANLAQQASLQQQINEAQAKIDQQKKFLGEDIKTMYIDGQLSTIEELATSKNLSDYVDREEYRTTVQNKIDIGIKQIAALQAQLQKQKADLDVLVNSQKQQNDQLGAAQYQQQQLLAYNEGQQVAYNQQISVNSGAIAELRRQQIAANSRFIGGAGNGAACGGGYPAKWCEIDKDSVLDNWGMYNRECVSYTAFRVAASGRYMPYWGGVGDAWQWAFERPWTGRPGNNAQNAGIPVDDNPQAGDVAISNSGGWGHSMYVESVNSNGTINISQYNTDFSGRYSTNTISPGGLRFIHF